MSFQQERHQNTASVVADKSIVVSKSIRILGIYFDSKLCWHEHVTRSVFSANSAKQTLSIISKYFSSSELLQLLTAYFYSRLYYGAKVWLHSGLSLYLKKKLWKASSHMLQVVNKDFSRQNSFMELHRQYKRATPMMWSNYMTAMSMHDMLCDQLFDYLNPSFTLNVLHSERRRAPLFTRSNKTKIGFNCVSNRLQVVSTTLTDDWTLLNRNSFKVLCKKLFIDNELLRIQRLLCYPLCDRQS